MQKEYVLYNLDHGFEEKNTFYIGKYLISVSEEQANNRKQLCQNEKSTFTVDEALNRTIVKTQAKLGSVVPTATLSIDAADITNSVLYTELEDRNSVDDFILILSFITGRRAYLEHEIREGVSTKYFDRVVNNNFFRHPNIDVDGGLTKLKELKLTTPFYNLVYINTVQDLPTICFYANTIINALYDTWGKKNNATTYPALPIINIPAIRQYLVSKIEKSLLAKVKVLVISFLSKNSNEPIVINDIVARIKINTEPSALYKLEKFLVALTLMPSNPNEEVRERLNILNKVRNAMMHMGDVSKYKSMHFNRRAELTADLTFMLVGIAEYYFAKEIFNIDNYLIQQHADDIRLYFNTGVFRGKKIFEETYEQFSKRQEDEWIENGIYI